MFKPGDRIKRIGKDWRGLKVGNIYTVVSCKSDGGYIDLTLQEFNWFPDYKLFVLASPVTRHLVESKLP